LVRGEVFNALNRPNFGRPLEHLEHGLQHDHEHVGDARIVQLVQKYYF